MERKSYPTFLGIGTQKGGTTWLYENLKKHPEIWMPSIKELHYFDRDKKYPSPSRLTTERVFNRIVTDKTYHKRALKMAKSMLSAAVRRDKSLFDWQKKWYFGNYTDDWYCSLYEAGMGYKVRGEITPSYMVVDNYDIESMYSINPNMKLLFIIRNPVERAWATVKYTAKYAGYPLDISDDRAVIEKVTTAEFLAHGDYISTINRFLKVFPLENFLLCFYDAIIDQPYLLIEKVFRFLGADPNKGDYSDLYSKVNPSSDEKMSDNVRQYLTDIYKDDIMKIQKAFGGYTLSWGFNKGVTHQKECPVAIHPFII